MFADNLPCGVSAYIVVAVFLKFRLHYTTICKIVNKIINIFCKIFENIYNLSKTDSNVVIFWRKLSKDFCKNGHIVVNTY